MKILLFLGLFLSQFANAFDVPSKEQQISIMSDLRSEILRIDGEGLLARKNRSMGFSETIDTLISEMDQNKSITDFFRSFKRLDATYTNLHSRVVFADEVTNEIDLPYHKFPSLWLIAETDNDNVALKIEHITDEETSRLVSEGDQLVKINSRPISIWLEENFLFCKYTLKSQCNRSFEEDLLSLNLSWKGQTPLIYTFLHQGVEVNVEFKLRDYASSQSKPTGAEVDKRRCDYRASIKYPQFKLVHLGYNACLFQHEIKPEIYVLRINSFQYHRKTAISLNPYSSVQEEVEALAKDFLPIAGEVKNLIIDVLDNGGGNAPISYYKILFQTPFQEEYVQIKKFAEIENSEIRKNIFWGDQAHENWFQKLVDQSIWQSLALGEFTRPVPMFCADEDDACDGQLFYPLEHKFKGKVYAMVNENCISSCDGFTWAIVKSLNAKLFGFPQAADSAFSRLRIDFIKNPNSKKGYDVEINAHDAELNPNLIVGQIVAVSKATDREGNILNGNPLPLTKKIEYKINQNYSLEVLKSVLSYIENNH
jgi:hypothetical protein